MQIARFDRRPPHVLNTRPEHADLGVNTWSDAYINHETKKEPKGYHCSNLHSTYHPPESTGTGNGGQTTSTGRQASSVHQAFTKFDCSKIQFDLFKDKSGANRLRGRPCGGRRTVRVGGLGGTEWGLPDGRAAKHW